MPSSGGGLYLKVIGWGWFYLSTILDDYSRYIVAWKLCTTMRANDVTETLTLALQASGCGSADVVHKPRLLSDNGSSHIADDLADWLKAKGMDHVRRAPNHPQTQGNLMPADVYFGRGQAIIKRRRRIKDATMKKRRLAHMRQVA